MSIMSNSRSLPDSGTIQTGAPEAGTGGGRPPARPDSHQIRPASMPAIKIEIRVDPIEMILFSMVRWNGEPWN